MKAAQPESLPPAVSGSGGIRRSTRAWTDAASSAVKKCQVLVSIGWGALVAPGVQGSLPENVSARTLETEAANAAPATRTWRRDWPGRPESFFIHRSPDQAVHSVPSGQSYRIAIRRSISSRRSIRSGSGAGLLKDGLAQAFRPPPFGFRILPAECYRRRRSLVTWGMGFRGWEGERRQAAFRAGSDQAVALRRRWLCHPVAAFGDPFEHARRPERPGARLRPAPRAGRRRRNRNHRL